MAAEKSLHTALPMIMSLALSILVLTAAYGSDIKPAAGDSCPVCGMFVSKYPDFLAKVVFEDGASAYFDGPKDMFRFILEKNRYLPAKSDRKITEMLVTDYYQVRAIDAREAWYVTGSDVLGPMGNELIPFNTGEEAREFMKDHGGKNMVRFNEITDVLLRELDKRP